MTIVWLALLLGLPGSAFMWSSIRFRSSGHRRRSIATALGGGVLVLLGVLALGVWVWANTATDSSQLARALLWGDSDVADIERFPAVPVRAGPDPHTFETGDGGVVESFRLDGAEQAFVDTLEGRDTNALLVLRLDRLIYEGYFGGEGRDDLHTSFSVAKSFMSTLIGIAVDEGHIAGLDDPITVYLPELAERDERFGAITVRHLLVMASGIAFDDGSSPWADPATTYYSTDLRHAALTTTRIESAPGRIWQYNDWNTVLLGMLLERSTGEPVSSYLESRLWQPIGAEADGSWSLDSERGGFEKSFVGVNAIARDYLKLGWLYLHGGTVDSTRIVSRAYVDAATAVDRSANGVDRYGYQWWIDVDNASFFANGDHCQLIYVQPATDLVIVRLGSSCGDTDWPDTLGRLAGWIAEQS